MLHVIVHLVWTLFSANFGWHSVLPKFVGACGCWCMIFTVGDIIALRAPYIGVWLSAMNNSACFCELFFSS